MPFVVRQENGDLHVWLQYDNQPPELVVPSKRWGGDYMAARRYINGHNKYWILTARACERFCAKVLSEPIQYSWVNPRFLSNTP